MKSEQTQDQWIDAFMASEESLEPISPQFHDKLMQKLNAPVAKPTPFLTPSLMRIAFILGAFIILATLGLYYGGPYLINFSFSLPEVNIPSSFNLWKNISYLVGCGFILAAFKELLDHKLWTPNT